MKLDIKKDPEAKYYLVIDKTTGRHIHDVIAADDETGEYTIYRKDQSGRFIIKGDELDTQLCKGFIELKRAY